MGYKTVSCYHYKSYKREALEMPFSKKPIASKLGDLGEAKSSFTQSKALTGKNCTTAVHREMLPFMVSELIIEELSIASEGTNKLKTVDVWAVSMTFFTILNLDRSVLSILKCFKKYPQ